MTLPRGITGSLCPAFAPDRLVGLPGQAPLCHCTLRLITNQPEGTFGSLRYAFGGDHPSQTTHHAVSPYHGLDPRQEKGRISTMAPRFLAKPNRSLRPILHVPCPGTTRSCSKGSRGSFRPVAGTRHLHRNYNFTELMVETVPRSLHHSCRSELTRQGISLP